jgi:hypothetical protein
MDKWEYAVVPLDEVGGLSKKAHDLRPERLNELGSQGWEAVGCRSKGAILSRGLWSCSSARSRSHRVVGEGVSWELS